MKSEIVKVRNGENVVTHVTPPLVADSGVDPTETHLCNVVSSPFFSRFLFVLNHRRSGLRWQLGTPRFMDEYLHHFPFHLISTLPIKSKSLFRIKIMESIIVSHLGSSHSLKGNWPYTFVRLIRLERFAKNRSLFIKVKVDVWKSVLADDTGNCWRTRRRAFTITYRTRQWWLVCVDMILMLSTLTNKRQFRSIGEGAGLLGWFFEHCLFHCSSNQPACSFP